MNYSFSISVLTTSAISSSRVSVPIVFRLTTILLFRQFSYPRVAKLKRFE